MKANVVTIYTCWYAVLLGTLQCTHYHYKYNLCVTTYQTDQTEVCTSVGQLVLTVGG